MFDRTSQNPEGFIHSFEPDDSLRLIPLGGLGEVGMNLMLYECRGRILMVDCGLIFPTHEDLGVQYLIPDLSYLLENADKVESIFLTHGHEDHIGALPHVLGEIDVPVYGTRLTLGIVRAKLSEWGLELKADLREITEGEFVEAGPYSVEVIPVTHSIIGAVAFAVRTPQGVVFQTGDFKIDPTPMPHQSIDLDRIGEIGDEGVLALLSDSTNIGREGWTPSERTVGKALYEIFEGHTGRIVVATFSSNIDRIQQVIDCATGTGRRVALIGRSLLNTTAIARELGYLNYPPTTIRESREIDRHDPSELCIITTGTQGEPFSALARIAAGRHPSIRLGSEDLVILSSRTIPGNERAVGETLNGLYRQGVNVLYERVSEVHVSGHAAREEQRKMLELVRPTWFIPVHGETRQLVRHADLAVETGVPNSRVLRIEDGQVIRFRGGEAMVEGQVISGQWAIDKGLPRLLHEDLLNERFYLGSHGLLVATLQLSPAQGQLTAPARFETRGLILDGEIAHLEPVVREAVFEYYSGAGDYDSVEESVIGGLRRHFRRHDATVPFIVPVVIEVEA